MKMMTHVLACFLLLVMALTMALAGAETRDSAKNPRIVTLIELKAVIGTVQKLIYLESLALMGDVGEGGGGIRKWQQEFQTRYQNRLKTNGASTNVQAHEGRRFSYMRRRMPVEEFGRFEIKTIVEFRTKSHGIVAINNVYNYLLRDAAPYTSSNRPDVMSDLISLETIEGIMIPADEITDVTVEFKARP